jgi:hypothetical protein
MKVCQTMLEINWYPYSAPIVLTDDIYETYAGSDLLTQTSVGQRTAAYWLAEIKASEDIGTYLQKTIVTGTYGYFPVINLDHAYIHRIIRTTFIDFEEDRYYVIAGTSNVYINLVNQERGIVDIANAVSNCHCHSANLVSPYKVEFVYETGLYSGTTYQPDMLLGLSTYARIILNEMIGFGNEAPGDIGVQSYKNQEYSENRVKLINTTLGSSAQANFVHKMLTRFRKLKYVGLR